MSNLNMIGKQYKLHFDVLGVSIWRNGQLCDANESAEVALAIAESFAPSAYVYIGVSDDDETYKIGMTGNLEKRHKQLRIRPIHVIPCANALLARHAEKMLHEIYEDECIGGEWFDLLQCQITEIRSVKTYEDTLQLHDRVNGEGDVVWCYKRYKAWVMEMISLASEDEKPMLIEQTVKGLRELIKKIEDMP